MTAVAEKMVMMLFVRLFIMERLPWKFYGLDRSLFSE
jgi:hypothetical protein